MDYEKKYKEALGRANAKIDTYNHLGNTSVVKSICEIFPELKESEDERIRREMIEIIKNEAHEFPSSVIANKSNSWIAWLEKQCEKESDPRYENLEEILAADDIYQMSMNDEMVQEAKEKAVNALSGMCIGRLLGLEKQGEQKPIISNNALREGIAHFGITQYQIDNWLKKYVDIEKQVEQKPVDKVEPKFRVGDWIIKNDDSSINIDYSCCEITKVENGNYTIESIYGYKGYNTFETFEKDYHLWTIRDAKDGDVLASNGSIILFKEISNSARKDYKYIQSHCLILAHSSDFYTGGSYNLDDRFHPATKEQRDLLFQKMKEAGYEWDAEKKELKKIEQKSSWSEYDEAGLDDAMWKIEQAMGNLWRAERWLLSVKERMKGE